MATHHQYKRFVIGKNGVNYVEGMIEYGRDHVFLKKDGPKKWGMSCFGKMSAAEMSALSDGDKKTSYWNLGFVSDEYDELYLFPSMEGKNFAWCTKPTPYWFCRKRNWMPYWGKATKQRHELMNEMRAYWMNKWYGKTIPEIKHWLLKANPGLPEVIIGGLPEYFEYPHQVKTI